ncbi:hypothetical protein CEP54_002499 [Fusarium duplospermum]|uniref:Uncharacterized protein n=1 Tax=Fusarium duplospermum TaxID=1325734 RepID=A0A428QUG9_9HYPO|nr:hypothetical protein CEP54_002499 [Fusarium duplospermum]
MEKRDDKLKVSLDRGLALCAACGFVVVLLCEANSSALLTTGDKVQREADEKAEAAPPSDCASVFAAAAGAQQLRSRSFSVGSGPIALLAFLFVLSPP